MVNGYVGQHFLFVLFIALDFLFVAIVILSTDKARSSETSDFLWPIMLFFVLNSTSESVRSFEMLKRKF